MNPQDDLNNQPIQDPQIVPGSLQYMPSGPSGIGSGAESIPTIVVPEATAPEIFQPEVQKPVEAEPTVEKETFVPLAAVVEKKPAQEAPQVKQSIPQDKPNIVDKTKDIAPLHHIPQTHDKLTSIADKEEEEFIKEVETAHEHK